MRRSYLALALLVAGCAVQPKVTVQDVLYASRRSNPNIKLHTRMYETYDGNIVEQPSPPKSARDIAITYRDASYLDAKEGRRYDQNSASLYQITLPQDAGVKRTVTASGPNANVARMRALMQLTKKGSATLLHSYKETASTEVNGQHISSLEAIVAK